jgi:hypothetical protein
MIVDITNEARVSPPDPFPDTLEKLAEHAKGQGTHLFIAVPCYGCKMSTTFVTSLLRLEGFCLGHGIRLTFEFLGNESLITRGRCILAERAMRSNATHLLFIDADIGFSPHTILRMVAFDAPVTCGIYAKKGLNFNDVVACSKTDEKTLADSALNFNINLPKTKNHSVQNGFLEVMDAATGMMLIRMDCLKKLREIYAPTHLVKNDIPSSRDAMPEYVALFETVICGETRRFLSEDYAFCRKAQENGFRVYADIFAPLVHVGSMQYDGNLSHLLKTQLTI